MDKRLVNHSDETGLKDEATMSHQSDQLQFEDNRSKSYKSYSKNGAHGTLGTWGTVFAIMSTIVGGGIVSIPWAFYQAGFVQGVVFLGVTSCQVLLSTTLYLKAREMIPDQPQSMYE